MHSGLFFLKLKVNPNYKQVKCNLLCYENNQLEKGYSDFNNFALRLTSPFSGKMMFQTLSMLLQSLQMYNVTTFSKKGKVPKPYFLYINGKNIIQNKNKRSKYNLSFRHQSCVFVTSGCKTMWYYTLMIHASYVLFCMYFSKVRLNLNQTCTGSLVHKNIASHSSLDSA